MQKTIKKNGRPLSFWLNKQKHHIMKSLAIFKTKQFHINIMMFLSSAWNVREVLWLMAKISTGGWTYKERDIEQIQ